MIVLETEPIGPTVPTSLPTHRFHGSPAHGGGDQSGDSATEQANPVETDPILCRHCGRTASNGISCEGSCVADSGY
jgi:hypothetical protein